MVKLCERLSEILSVDELVWCILEAHLPAVRWRWGRRDEEELSSVRKGEMLVLGFHGCRLTEIDLQTLAHDSLAIPHLPDINGSLFIVEGDQDATERLERRPSVNEGRL